MQTRQDPRQVLGMARRRHSEHELGAHEAHEPTSNSRPAVREIVLESDPNDTKIPLLVVGDAPTLPTGLARICRDVTELVRRDCLTGVLPFRIAQLGLNYDGRRANWHVYPVQDTSNWGRGDIAKVWEDFAFAGQRSFPHQKGVVWSFWDPGRCPALYWALNQPDSERGGLSPIQDWMLQEIPWPRLWGYFAVDAENRAGSLGGPVPETLQGYQRVLGYTRWGAGVLSQAAGRTVPNLPHGIDLDVFQPAARPPKDLPDSWKDSKPIIGVVATNTPRKDWGLVFGALAGVDCHLWIHIDGLVADAWSIPELAELFGRDDKRKLWATNKLTDQEIAEWYTVCDATLAPGLGEGWGYPIVESLACGTPVVHGAYGGGKEVMPLAEWRVAPQAQRLEGPYALIRPVYAPAEVREALRLAVQWKRKEPDVAAAYCRGAVAHLDWRECWGYWRRWIQEGVEAL